MVCSEGNMSLKNPVTTPGIDPGTVRLVATTLPQALQFRLDDQGAGLRFPTGRTLFGFLAAAIPTIPPHIWRVLGLSRRGCQTDLPWALRDVSIKVYRGRGLGSHSPTRHSRMR